ncbi:MAG: hypothetical protein GEU90_04305 [Gemmatimonas sp.]|nr:hypothetical protein [Gemmatimonas sp.]
MTMVMNVEGGDGSPVAAMDLVGGDISMELVNTASGRTGEQLKDKLRTYDDLVGWAERVGLLGPRRSARLRQVATENPTKADETIARARSLREAIYRVFTTEVPDVKDLEELGRTAAEAAVERRIERSGTDYVMVWPESDALQQLLWPVAISATELLLSADRSRVKECAGEGCSWLFVDLSRNRSRRWCDMRECGNRAKARRFQARQRGRQNG